MFKATASEGHTVLVQPKQRPVDRAKISLSAHSQNTSTVNDYTSLQKALFFSAVKTEIAGFY
jgi:hypothetical protein